MSKTKAYPVGLGIFISEGQNNLLNKLNNKSEYIRDLLDKNLPGDLAKQEAEKKEKKRRGLL